MYLIDEHNNYIEAECSLDIFEGKPCVVVESSGGAAPDRGIARRNPEYNKALALIFQRLALKCIKVTRVVLDSRKVARVRVEDRIPELEQYPYPVNLEDIDIEVYRKALQNKISSMHRDSNALLKPGKGNSQRRIRICISKPISPDDLIGTYGESVPGGEISEPRSGLKDTERDYLRKARVGQGEFRDNLLDKYDGVCPITGISNPALLVASHIKPWKVCTNHERLDPANGILLSALIDRLFDRGLITFSDNGTLKVSTKLSKEDLNRCGLTQVGRFELPASSQLYMEYHRVMEFLG